MHTNSYAGIVEPNVSQIVACRAARLEIPQEEIADLQQQIVPKLAAFKFDVTRSNGASRTTVLTSVIDRQIRAYLRAKRRYRLRVERTRLVSGRGSRALPTQWITMPEPGDLRMDLEVAMTNLAERDRKICFALSRGQTHKAIAEQLGCARETVGTAVKRIRRAFIAAGMKAWIDPHVAECAGSTSAKTD